MINNKLLRTLYLGNRFQIRKYFNRRKGLQENIKQKQNKKIQQNDKSQNSQTSSQNLMQVSNMKILNIQFFPASLLITPTLFYYQECFDPNFLLGQLLVQKYASIALLMNIDFQGDKRKIALFLTIMASFHMLTGYYSIGTPFGMAFLTIMAPFKFMKQQQKYNQIESIRMKTMSNIKMSYFFIFILLTTLKALHYQQTYTIQKKLNQINQQNIENINLKKQSL